MKRVFVYGSLKPGGWAAGRLQGHVDNPRDGLISGQLFDTGNGFPALKLGTEFWPAEPAVKGILYDVQEEDFEALLQDLDRLEGYPHLYDRTLVTVNASGELVPDVLVYFGNDNRLFKTVIESGEWNVN